MQHHQDDFFYGIFTLTICIATAGLAVVVLAAAL